MTLGGISGMAITTPAGAVVHASRYKRLLLIVSGLCSISCQRQFFFHIVFGFVAASQVATAIAGAAIGPAVVGTTLGLVGQAGFNQQNGRNQAFNHAGNVIGAGASGYLGWHYGLPAIFILAGGFGLLAIASTFFIPAKAIDHRRARGQAESDADGVGRVHAEGRHLTLISRNSDQT